MVTLPLVRGVRAAAPLGIKIANAAGALNLAMAELMRQQKFLESFGVAPEFLTVADGTRILGGVVSGSVDVSMASGFAQVFPAVEHGAPLKILAGGALLPALALFSSKPDIKTPRDLAGKTIGTGSVGALVHQLTVALLDKYGVDTTSIRFVNVGSSADIFRAVAAGTVEGGLADVTLIQEAAAHHVHLVEHGNLSSELPEYTYQGAWTSDRTIKAERESLVRTLAAYARLYRFVQDSGSRDAFLRARRSVFPNAPEREHMAQWSYIQTYRPFAVDLVLSPERLRYVQELNLRFRTQKAVMPFERIADMSLARDALKLVDTGRI